MAWRLDKHGDNLIPTYYENNYNIAASLQTRKHDVIEFRHKKVIPSTTRSVYFDNNNVPSNQLHENRPLQY